MNFRMFAVALLAATLLLPAFGCEKEGPAEKAGEKIDQAVDHAKQEAGKAWDDVKDKAKELDR
ncbi:MAG: hypothetical protein PWQ57_3218 [Desulfovibrionales bacterium]|jgi:hypothetical protein|nr:hypothetical protein [Desulfovibrionales bacterium]